MKDEVKKRKPLSEKHKQKLREYRKLYPYSHEWYVKIGKLGASKANHKMPKNPKKFRKGNIPWNKGRKMPKEFRENAIKNLLGGGWNKGQTFPEWSERHKRLWATEEHRNKVLKGFSIKPTQPELYLDAILQLNFPKEWKYVGDSKFWIEHHNPDFINCNGKKLIIEFDGIYWHSTESAKKRDLERREIFAKYGYKTLSINEEDLKNETDLILKIRNFYGK